MRVTMTDKTLRKLAAPASGQADYFDKATPGFGLRVSANGARSWIVLYRHGGRKKRLTLGPESALSLAQARSQAKNALARARLGEDPAGEKRAAREAATFGEVAKEYLAFIDKARLRSRREKRRMLETDVLPTWRARRAADIDARDVRALVDAIVDRGSPVAANRTFSLIRRVFAWASAPDRALVPQHHNPCRGMERPASETPCERVLTEDELRRIWPALHGEDVGDAGPILKLMLWTAQRGGEVKKMRWSDLDLDAAWWTVPAEDAKNHRAHRVPLSPPAVALLRERQATRESASSYVFPSKRAVEGRRTTIVKAVADIRAASGVTDWTPHDVRRTVTTFLTSELEVPRLIAAKVLNHTDRGITAVYDRAAYDRQKRAALEAWATRLNAIVTGEAPPKVVSLRA